MSFNNITVLTIIVMPIMLFFLENVDKRTIDFIKRINVIENVHSDADNDNYILKLRYI